MEAIAPLLGQGWNLKARRAGFVQGHDAHQLARPDFSFVPALRRSNPGCNITLLTDQSTQFAGLPAGVQVFRHPLDKARLGRNAWANYYQFRAQQARLAPCRAQAPAFSCISRTCSALCHLSHCACVNA